MAFFKFLSDRVPVFQSLAVRSVFCSVMSVLLCRRQRIALFEPRKKIHLFIARGVLGGLCNTGLYVSSSLLPLSEAAFMSNSFPGKTSEIDEMVMVSRCSGDSRLLLAFGF